MSTKVRPDEGERERAGGPAAAGLTRRRARALRAVLGVHAETMAAGTRRDGAKASSRRLEDSVWMLDVSPKRMI